MIEITVSAVDMQKIQDRLSKLQLSDQAQVIVKSFKTSALMVERKLKENVSGSLLKVRSGRLRSSIGSMITHDGASLIAEIGSGVRQGNRVPYANILETGGVIRPKNKRYLTVPLKEAMTESGVARFTAQDVKSGATKYEGSFINKGIIFGKIGKSIVPLFVLKTSVTIPAKYWMSRTASESSQEVVETILKTINEVLKG